jgi:hypothetical protein
MALRIDSSPCDAGNKPGLLAVAASDWHHGLADFHLGTGHTIPLTMPDIRLQAISDPPELSVIFYLREESI